MGTNTSGKSGMGQIKSSDFNRAEAARKLGEGADHYGECRLSSLAGLGPAPGNHFHDGAAARAVYSSLSSWKILVKTDQQNIKKADQSLSRSDQSSSKNFQ